MEMPMGQHLIFCYGARSLASVVVAAASALFAPDLATPDKLASALFVFDHRLCSEAAATAKEVAPLPAATLSAASATSRPHNSCHRVLCAVIWAWLDVDKAFLVYRQRLRAVLGCSAIPIQCWTSN